MRFNEAEVRILVRKDYGACYDFYTEKMGLIPVWGDRNGPYTSLTQKEGERARFALFNGAAMEQLDGYKQPDANTPTDTFVITIPTDDLEGDCKRLREAGVEFLCQPQAQDAWGFRCAYFRDTEGNLIELASPNGFAEAPDSSE